MADSLQWSNVDVELRNDYFYFNKVGIPQNEAF
jgi:hypothetical protein